MTYVTREEYNALVERLEIIIRENKCEDEEVQRALLQVARDHMWKAGLWARIRWTANIIGALGIVAGGAAAVATFFGYEVIRR